MKRVVLFGAMIAALGIAVMVASASSAPNFAGTWTLDKSKSQGLDQRMTNAESVTCVITQDDKSLSIEWKVAPGQPPAGGAPGGGAPGGGAPGGGAGRGPAGPRVFTLDGKEVTSEGPMSSTNTSKATWSTDGNTLELLTVRAGSREGQEFKFTTTDKLSLSADGKVMTIARSSESPRGKTDSTLVFNKQ